MKNVSINIDKHPPQNQLVLNNRLILFFYTNTPPLTAVSRDEICNTTLYICFLWTGGKRNEKMYNYM